MNDQQIYTLMAKTPNIRAVQIADALDVEMKDASEALRSLVAVGDVVAHSGEAPNGQPTRMYNLSTQFKESKDGRALLQSVVRTMLTGPAALALPPAPPAPAPPAPAPAPPAPDPLATPVFSTQKEMAPARTKAQITIEHLTAHKRNVDPGKRPVTDGDLRALLGLPRASQPRAYLTSHLRSGQIVRDANGHWSLGDGTPPPPAGQSPSLRSYGSKKKGGPVAQFPPTAQPEEEDPVQPEACKHDTPFRYECDECLDAAKPATKGTVTDEPNPFDDPAAPPTEPQPPIEEASPMSQPEPSQPEPAAAPAPAAATVFRCGLWSDGVLELQRDGVQVAALNRGEHEQLAEFMGRMWGQVEKAIA